MTAGVSTQNLADLLNHGILPFVGRDEELERVLSFWKQTIDAEALRILLLVGEAGIGESRLIEELIPRISSVGGAVIHAKLSPDSSTRITPLLVRSMWQSATGRELLKNEPKDTREYLLSGLRHISSLRPTIVFLEDLHLLSHDGIRELSSILESLTDETISFCIATRPSMQQARTVLERYSTAEIDLEGLDHATFGPKCRSRTCQHSQHDRSRVGSAMCSNAYRLVYSVSGVAHPV